MKLGDKVKVIDCDFEFDEYQIGDEGTIRWVGEYGTIDEQIVRVKFTFGERHVIKREIEVIK